MIAFATYLSRETHGTYSYTFSLGVLSPRRDDGDAFGVRENDDQTRGIFSHARRTSMRAPPPPPRAIPRVIARDANEPIATVTCVALTRVPVRATAGLLGDVRAHGAWPSALAHVKRARKAPDGAHTMILLAVARGEGDAKGEIDALDALAGAVRARCGDGTADDAGAFAYVEVPASAPSTKDEWDEANEMWPVSLVVANPHEVMPVPAATAEEEAYAVRWMTAAVKAAAEATTTSTTIGNCAIIVDPASGEEIARAVDESEMHPLRHAALAAVDYAAKRDVATYPETVGVQAQIDERRAEKLARGVAVVADDDEDNVNDVKKRKRDAGTNGATVTELMGRPYLCTGYDAFLAREPCVMCAMALVHSRLKRVFFAAPNAETGALSGDKAGVRRLHSVRSLNHHYQVFSYDVDEDGLRAIADSTH